MYATFSGQGVVQSAWGIVRCTAGVSCKDGKYVPHTRKSKKTYLLASGAVCDLICLCYEPPQLGKGHSDWN